MELLRPYQSAAVEAVYNHLRTKDTNPCVVIPCGCGKSHVIAKIATDAAQLWNGRVLVLAHVKELLEQNTDKISRLCPELKVGIYSAGLKSRDTQENVIVAGIQSVYNKACELEAFDIVMIDECHLLNSTSDDSMYKTLLSDMSVINPNVRLIGLTATPFRMKGGQICKPENMLNEVCYEAGLKEMIQQGYLSPLVSRAGRVEAKLDDLHIRGGEFIGDEIAAAMDTEELVDAACREIVSLTSERKSILIFTSSVEHCRHVADKISKLSSEECAIVTGNTSPGERAEIIARFKRERVAGDLNGFAKPPIKFLANVNVLTTGFDAPNTDCVVLLRPTNSPGLLIQMVGRATRLSPETGKKDALILDYGGNILRHGPIDMIRITDKTPGNGEAPAKECPQCLSLIYAAYQTCPECGWEFPPQGKSNITETASREGIISGETICTEHEVTNTHYAVHEKRNADPDTPRTMRVDYEIAFNQYVSEWTCPEHKGYAREKFVKWWRLRAANGCPVPKTAEAATRMAEEGCLAQPLSITVKHVAGEKYDRVTGYQFGAKPVYIPEPGWNDALDEVANLEPAAILDTGDDIPF